MIRFITIVALLTVAQIAFSAEFQWSGKFERNLSAYNIFTDSANQIPNDSFLPYDVITPLFSDYADKHRFIYLPEGTSMTYDADAAFDMPVGAVLVKTFSYPFDARYPEQGRRLVETRLMVHTAKGWAGAAYLWNDEQTDATLKIAGAEVPVDWIDEQGYCRSIKYLVPDMNQCKNCHRDTTGEMNPIGIKARHLNRAAPKVDGASRSVPKSSHASEIPVNLSNNEDPRHHFPNQLDTWSQTGILKNAPPSSEAPALPAAENSALPIADRAMAYFEVNCAHCHNPKGLASHTRLDLRGMQSDPAARGVMKKPTASGNASRGRYFAIVPGNPDASFLVHRMESARPDVRMPPVGRTVPHAEGAELIRAWIATLPPE